MQAEKPNPEPTEWQPIETAPKAEADQDDIWIWAARRGTKLPMLTTWDAEEGHWYTFNLALETGMRRWEPGWKWEPTHWMPLQEVPKMSNSETTPKRVRRRRIQGWRMPPGAIYVGRPTRWANRHNWREIFEFGGDGEAWARQVAVNRFREDVRRLPPLAFQEIRDTLRGRDLACWCPLDQPCHGDILLEIANG